MIAATCFSMPPIFAVGSKQGHRQGLQPDKKMGHIVRDQSLPGHRQRVPAVSDESELRLNRRRLRRHWRHSVSNQLMGGIGGVVEHLPRKHS
jgi:hypothetical protein